MRGYGNYSRTEEDSEVSVEALEIVQELSFLEFIDAIEKEAASLIVQSYGISNGSGIR